MKEDYSGEKFLDRLYKDLYFSDEVNNSVKRSKKKNLKKEEAIKIYMDRLERLNNLANNSKKKDYLKEFYYRKYVIKEDNIPNRFDKKEVIQMQEKRLSMWLDYLMDENAMYPMWAKYWAFQGMLKLGKYDYVHEVYQRRSEKTLDPFVEANPEIISNCINNLITYLKSKQSSDEELKPLLKSGSFKKLYEYYEKKIRNANIDRTSTIGKWVKYRKGNREDAIALAKSLENKNTGWCTANENMAIFQVCGGNQYVGGDFYVYYTLDNKNEFTIPRIAIRMDGENKIGEIRGVKDNQNLEESMVDVLETKLNEMSFISEKDKYENYDKIEGLRELFRIYKKTVLKEELSEYEIISLYNKKYGFGWENDPQVEKTIKLRDAGADVDRIKSLDEKVSLFNLVMIKKMLPESYKSSDKQFIIKFYNTFKKICPLYEYGFYDYISDELKKDKDIILIMLDFDGSLADSFPPSLLEDREFMLDAIGVRDLVFYFLKDSPFVKDREFVLEAAKRNGRILSWVDPSFKNDREIVLEAIISHPYNAMSYPKFMEDRDFVLSAVKREPLVFPYATSFLDDKEIALEAVKGDAYELVQASERLKNDKDVVLEAIKKDVFVFDLIPPELKKDREIVKESLIRNCDAFSYDADPSLKEDRDFALEILKQNGSELFAFGLDLKKDKEVVLTALNSKSSLAFTFFVIDEELQKDRDIVLVGVKRWGYILSKLDPKFKKDREVVLEAVKQDGKALEFADPILQKDKEIVLEAVKQNSEALLFAHPSLKNDKDIVEETIRKDLFTYKYASKELKEDNKFLNDVIKKYPQDFEKFLSVHWEKLPYIDDKKRKLCYYVKEQLDKIKSNKITKFKPNNKQIKKSNIVVFPIVEENEELVKTI